jgi:hypothetical protein
MARRPRPGEDDLDAMLTDFESGRVQPAAVVVKKDPKAAPPPIEPKRSTSKFARDRASRTAADPRPKKSEPEDVKLEPMEDVVGQLVLRGIVERDVEQLAVVAPPTWTGPAQADFPPIIKLTTTKFGEGDNEVPSKPSRRSIFAQQFMKMKRSLSDMDTDEQDTPFTSSVSGRDGSLLRPHS